MWGVLWKKTVTLHGVKVDILNDPALLTSRLVTAGWYQNSSWLKCWKAQFSAHSFVLKFTSKYKQNKEIQSHVSFAQHSHRWKRSGALSLSLLLFPSIFHSPSLRQCFCDNGAIQMLWKGRRKGAVNSQERAESEAGLCLQFTHVCRSTCLLSC